MHMLYIYVIDDTTDFFKSLSTFVSDFYDITKYAKRMEKNLFCFEWCLVP